MKRVSISKTVLGDFHSHKADSLIRYGTLRGARVGQHLLLRDAHGCYVIRLIGSIDGNHSRYIHGIGSPRFRETPDGRRAVKQDHFRHLAETSACVTPTRAAFFFEGVVNIQNSLLIFDVRPLFDRYIVLHRLSKEPIRVRSVAHVPIAHVQAFREFQRDWASLRGIDFVAAAVEFCRIVGDAALTPEALLVKQAIVEGPPQWNR